MSYIQSRNLFNVNELVAVVTGGGTGLQLHEHQARMVAHLSNIGIGQMITNALVENGAAKVYIVGRREVKLREAAKKFPK